MNKKHTELINEFLADKGDTIQPQTKRNYTNLFIRLLNLIIGNNKRKYILAISQPQLIKKIDNSDFTLNTKIDSLKLIKYLLEFTYKTYKPVQKQLTKYYGMTADERPTKNKELLKDTIQYDELMKILNEADELDYILFYLLINFNTRNKDLVINYTNDKKIIKNVIDGILKINILYFKNNDLYYTRGDYKTHSIYGDKTDKITDKKFIQILKHTPINKNIFINSKDRPYNHTEINKYIQSRFKQYTNHLLNQSKIYKIIVDHHENNTKKLKNISNHRGHSLDTQNNYYSTY